VYLFFVSICFSFHVFGTQNAPVLPVRIHVISGVNPRKKFDEVC